jgi:microcompartment protein CcmL/EutN
MSMPKSIGAIELSSVGVGYKAQDALLKAANVQMLVARTICSGKYFMVFGGGVSDVSSAIRAGLEAGGEAIIDHLLIPNVHESVFQALGQSVVLDPRQAEAVGVIETFSGTSVIAAADAAVKAARVTLFRLHVAMALGGKGLLLLAGTIADCRAAVAAGAQEVRERGLLVSEIVIPNASKELYNEYI